MISVNKQNNIVFLTLYFPEGSGGYTFRNKLMAILDSMSEIDNILCINSDSNFFENVTQDLNSTKIKFINIGKHDSKRGLIKILSYLSVQLKALLQIIKLRNEYSVIIMMCGNEFFIPSFFAKIILNKKIAYILSGVTRSSMKNYNRKLYVTDFLFVLFEKILLSISDLIVLETPALFRVLESELFKHKHRVAKRGYLYVNLSNKKNKLKNKKKVIGYIGRLSREKGILSLIEAIPLVISRRNDLEFQIIGDGPLRKSIEEYLQRKNLEHRVKLIGPVPHNLVFEHLTKLNLLILPSYIEGLPNILLEAMACGTPVMATDVGGILDIVVDKKTGFILKSNAPENITKTITKVLDTHGNKLLYKIRNNAITYIKKEFNYETAIMRYRKIFKMLLQVEGEW